MHINTRIAGVAAIVTAGVTAAIIAASLPERRAEKAAVVVRCFQPTDDEEPPHDHELVQVISNERGRVRLLCRPCGSESISIEVRAIE